jgi:hypothetical protein
MSELELYYRNFSMGQWAHSDASRCRCGGSGWALSEVDTWHTCPIHYTGQTHPECEEPEKPRTLTENERMVLKGLYQTNALPGTSHGSCFTWNLCEVLRGLADLDLIVYREVPRHDGELVAQLTERGVRSYQKGVRMGVYRRAA